MKKITLLFFAFFTLLIAPTLAQESDFSAFPDVPENHIFKQAITESAGTIIRGYADNTFQPERRVSRRELFVMVAREQFKEEDLQKCNVDQVPFADFDKVDWGNKEICMGYQAGYISGDDLTQTLRPNDDVNVVEALKVVSEARGTPVNLTGTGGEWFAGYIKANEKALPTTFSHFNKEVTRAEFTEVLWRLNEESDDLLHTTYADLSAPLGGIESCQELAGLVKEGWKQSQYLQYPYFRGDIMEMPMTSEFQSDSSAPMESSSSGAGGKSFSETNIQVQGVDEADIVKTDGEYIYAADEGVVKIIQAQPVSGMKELAQLKFDDFWPQEMYLHQNGGKKYLVIAGGTKGYTLFSEDQSMTTRMWPGFGGETQVHILDVTLPTQPKNLHQFTVEGHLSASRLLVKDSTAYFVTNNHFNLWGLSPEEIEALKGEQLLPLLKKGDGLARPALDCSGIPYVKGFIDPQSLLVTSIDLKSGNLSSEMILGASAQTMYMSLNHLYLTQPSQHHRIYSDFSVERDKSSTQIFKLPLSLNQPALANQVPGWLLNQFSLDEHKGHLRVATTVGDLWWRGDESSNGVYVLSPTMEMTGKVENLAPTERIYSARFMGDRGYLVTFRQVDPLFALNLSDPKAPKVVGELKIPGFSNYLHPFGENHLIGIGQDADENTGQTQGPKVSLFNVADPNDLKEVDSVILGSSGYSEAFYNHKAVLFSEDKFAEGEALLSFPVEMWDKVADHPECASMDVDSCDLSKCLVVPTESVCTPIAGGGQICTSEGDMCQSNSFHQENFNGAVVFGVTENGLEEKARISHASEMEGEKKDYTDWREQVYRVLWIAEDLFTLSRGAIQAHDLSDLALLKGQLKLSGSL